MPNLGFYLENGKFVHAVEDRVITRQEIYEEFKEYMPLLQDIRCKMGQLKTYLLNEDKNIGFRVNSQDIAPTSFSLGQLLNKLTIPAPYFNRCPTSLNKPALDYWISKFSDKKVLIRTCDNYQAIAFLSQHYNTNMDTHRIIPLYIKAIEEFFNENQNLVLNNRMVVSGSFNYSFSEMPVIFNNCEVEHEGIRYHPSITLQTSEIGMASLSIKPVIRCTGYGNFLDNSNEGSKSFRHTNQSLDTIGNPDGVIQIFLKAIKNAFRVSQIGIHRMIELAQNPLKKPLKEISKELVTSDDTIPSRAALFINDYLENIQELTELKLMLAAAKAVEDLPEFQKDKAIKSIGRYFRLFEKSDERADNIKRALDLDDLDDLEE